MSVASRACPWPWGRVSPIGDREALAGFNDSNLEFQPASCGIGLWKRIWIILLLPVLPENQFPFGFQAVGTGKRWPSSNFCQQHLLLRPLPQPAIWGPSWTSFSLWVLYSTHCRSLGIFPPGRLNAAFILSCSCSPRLVVKDYPSPEMPMAAFHFPSLIPTSAEPSPASRPAPPTQITFSAQPPEKINLTLSSSSFSCTFKAGRLRLLVRIKAKALRIFQFSFLKYPLSSYCQLGNWTITA